MWTIFKIINLIWLLSSTYAWFTTYTSLTPILIIVNVVMIVSMGFLPFKIYFDKVIGRVLLAIVGLMIWSILCDGIIMGICTLLAYLPVIFLIMLPTDYKKDLLQFVTKWYSYMIAFGLVEYFVTLVVPLPAFGRFVYLSYEPFDNYLFYIKTTFDNGIFTRFNAFFLEPGHQALASTFLIMANSFNFKKNRYCIILLIAVIFSFSLAGYLLLFTGWTLTWIRNFKRAIISVIGIISLVVIALSGILGDSVFNELIVSRLEYDQEKGIKGNNRYFNNTDFVFQQAQKKGETLVGVKDKVNMELVGGAGFKIYVIKNGWIGVLFVILFYLSVIPKGFNPRYTVIFLIVLTLCFIQRSYPSWYSWLLPYILGIYIHKQEPWDDNLLDKNEEDKAIYYY